MKVMICGYGSCGQYLLDFILKDHRINKIDKLYIVSRKTEGEVTPRLEISKVAAGITNRAIPIKYIQCDFNNIDRLSEIISLVEPEVIVYTGRYASGLKYGAYSYPKGIGYGVWLPMSFPYIYKLMQAVKLSGVKTKVINTSFPDGVNPLLDTVGLAPYCGAGNINHLIPRIRRAASQLYGGLEFDYDVNMVCGHYVNTYLSKEGTLKGGECYLEVIDNNRNTIFKYDSKSGNIPKDSEKFFSLVKDNSMSGQIRNQMIATDCSELVRIFTNETSNDAIHVPGVNGRPGGQKYLSLYGELIPCNTDNIDLSINTQNLLKDGVVIGKGYVEFTEIARDSMMSNYNLEYPERLNVEDMQKFADIIRDKLKEIKI